jgi:hypothetical protein
MPETTVFLVDIMYSNSLHRPVRELHQDIGISNQINLSTQYVSALSDRGIPTIVVDYESSSNFFFRIGIGDDTQRKSVASSSRDNAKSMYGSVRLPGLSEFRVNNVECKLSRRY